MLKTKYTKTEFESVDEKFRELYEEKNGYFFLKVEGDDDNLAGLKAQADKLLNEKREESEKRRELEVKLAEIELKEKEADEKNKMDKGEFQNLLDQKTKEFEEKEKKLKEQAEKAQNQMKQTLLNLEVTKVATELAGDRAELITPHLQNRFEITEKDGKFEVIIKDATGLPNPAMTTEQLIEEFKGNTLYEPIIKGRNSSGGGAGGGAGGSGNNSEWEPFFNPANQAEYSITKQSELQEKDPTLYKQLRDKFNLDSPLATVQRNNIAGMR